MKARIHEIEIREDENLRVDLGNLDSLVESIKERGQIQALTVRSSTSKEFKYELVEGFRRMEAMKQLGYEEVEIDVKELSDDEVDWLRYDANDKRKANTWWEEAKFFLKKIGDGFTQEAIGEITKKNREYVKDRLNAFRLFEIGAQAPKDLDMRTAREITYAFREDWEDLIKKVIEEEISKEDVRLIVKNCKQMVSRLEILEATHEELAKDLEDFWLPLRYVKGTFADMEEEIAIRSGNPPRITQYLSAEEYPKEKISEYVREKHGEVIEKAMYWRVYIIPRSLKEIRGKWVQE